MTAWCVLGSLTPSQQYLARHASGSQSQHGVISRGDVGNLAMVWACADAVNTAFANQGVVRLLTKFEWMCWHYKYVFL